MLRSILLLLLLIAGAPAASFGQTAIVRGFVLEADGEQALQGATVALRAQNAIVRGAVSDADGYFYLGGLPAGSFDLEVSFIGFQTVTELITLRAGAITERTIRLEVSSEELDEIVVEADAESGITAGAAGVEPIRPADIARVPVPGASPDLAAYIQSVPGVVLPGDRGGQYFIRGGAEDQNLVLMDGVPVYGPFHILSSFSAFPESILDGATLHTGGFDASYGERMSSILDVRTRNGSKRAPSAAVSAAPFLSSAQIETPILPGRVSLIASGRRSLVQQVTPRLFGEDLIYDFGDVFAKLHGLVGRRHAISAFGMATEDEGNIRGSTRNFRNDPVPDLEPQIMDWSNRVAGARYELLPGRRSFGLVLTGGYSRFENAFGPEAGADRMGHIESTDGRLDLSWSPGPFSARAGALVRQVDTGHSLDNQFRDVPDQATYSASVVSGYATVDLRYGTATISPGLRVTALEGHSAAADPRIRVSWIPLFLPGAQQFTAAAGRYHQTVVGLTDRRDVGNVFSIWQPIPEARELPQADHLVLGWSGPVRSGLRASVELYAKRFENLLVQEFTVLPAQDVGLQQASGEAYGADVRLSVSNQPFIGETQLSGWISYSIGKVEYETERGVTYYPGHDRRHSGNAVLRAERGEVSLNVQAQVSSGLPFTPSSGFDVFQLLTPGTDVTTDPGIQRVLYGEPGSERQPVYARTDVFVERRIEEGRFVSTLRAGAMNVFARDNLFYYDLFTFRRVNQLPLIPTVGYRLEFR